MLIATDCLDWLKAQPDNIGIDCRESQIELTTRRVAELEARPAAAG